MNKRRMIAVAAAVFLLICMTALTACKSTASETKETASGASAEYAAAETANDTFLLYVTFDSDADFFEVEQDIIVASDETFANPFTLLSCTPDNDCYIYEFSVPDGQMPDTIYIQPPVLVVPTEIDAVTFSPQQCLESQSMVYIQDEPWFTVSDISVSELESEVYRVIIRILPESVNIPRIASMKVNGKVIEALSSMNFNADGIFDFGEFYFDIPASGEEEVNEALANAEISISDALIRVDGVEFTYASDISNLTIYTQDDSSESAISSENAAAETADDTLLLYITFNNSDGPYEIVMPPSVSSDEAFTNVYAPLDYTLDRDNNRYIYEFSVPNGEIPDTIYMQPPLVLVPIEDGPITFSPQQCLEDQSVIYFQGEPWFTVTDISVTEMPHEEYDFETFGPAMMLTIRAYQENVHLLTDECINININGEIVGYASTFPNGTEGSFIYLIAASNEEEVYKALADAEISISSSRVRADEELVTYSTNIPDLTIIMIE